MRKVLFFLALCLCMVSQLPAQVSLQPDVIGSIDMQAGTNDEPSPKQQAAIIKMLRQNEAMLRSKGLLPKTNQPLLTGFQWPLSQPVGFNDYGYYVIVNYVDEDNTAGIKDYNCGNRTYDGHQGTDILTWPFPWQKMALGAVQIIAGAPGTIIGKTDGNIDTSCAACGACNWNAVYILQADGSVAWYGHMKEFSQTAKAIGQTVVAGEFLGIVGSSGSSTSPHLHFQVWKDNTYTQLIDPWAGTCNNFNGLTSWWASQQPYHVPTLLKIMTHSAAPAMVGCKYQEVVNSKINFVNGETVYLAAYFRDPENALVSTNTIYRPDNSVFSTWNYTWNTYYNGAYTLYTRVLPNPAPTGAWRYDVTFNGQPTQSTYFFVNETGYTFIGDGNWDIATNWSNNAIPPAVLPTGCEIIINPVTGGECLLNITQTISSADKITVSAGKKFRIPGQLKIQ